MKSPFALKGFTLVELMVAMSIIAILAAVAGPMYGNYVKNARADEGQAALAQIRAKQELYRSTHFTYAANLSDLPGFSADETAIGDYFMLSIEKGDRNAFVARAWDGQKAIQGSPGDQEWSITNTLDRPCRTKSSLQSTNDPCVEKVKAALE